MARGSDELDSAIKGGVVGLCTDEGGQEGVMDVDDLIGVGGDEVRGEDLHVAREDDKVDALLGEQREGGFFLLLFVLARDGEDVVGDVEFVRDAAHVLVIADDERDFYIPFTGGVASEQVKEAVGYLGDKECHAGLFIVEVELKGQFITLGVEHVEGVLNFFLWDAKVVELPLHAHEEDLLDALRVLGEVDDIAPIVVDEGGDGGEDTGLIGAVEEQDSRFVRGG